MNDIEEKLWNYIDGSCSDEEQKSISLLIESDDAYKLKYNELLQLNTEFLAMELDEPSMAFTYNVMEAIRTENAQQPLKAAIDKRIIWGIAAFFIITIAAVLLVALGSVNWSAPAAGGFRIPVKLPQMQNYFSGPVIKGFIFFDIVLSLFLMDGYLRKKLNNKQAQ
jgi:hypothetical protein